MHLHRWSWIHESQQQPLPGPEQAAGHVPRLPRHGRRGSRDPRTADGRLRLPGQELSLVTRPTLFRPSELA